MGILALELERHERAHFPEDESSVGRTMSSVGHTMSSVGHTMSSIGHTMASVGHTMSGAGHAIQSVGHTALACPTLGTEVEPGTAPAGSRAPPGARIRASRMCRLPRG